MPGVDAKKATLDELFEALSAQLICEPIELEDKIIIPIAKMGMGFGTNMDRTGPNVSEEGLERCSRRGSGGLSRCCGDRLQRYLWAGGREGCSLVAAGRIVIRHRSDLMERDDRP